MTERSSTGPRIRELTPEQKELVRTVFGEVVARHLHFHPELASGAFDQDQLIGVISAYGRPLPAPFQDRTELYIDVVEVVPTRRRQGIATALINSVMTAFKQNPGQWYQIRSWSSSPVQEMIALWGKLRFCLCPTTVRHCGRPIFGYFAARRH